MVDSEPLDKHQEGQDLIDSTFFTRKKVVEMILIDMQSFPLVTKIYMTHKSTASNTCVIHPHTWSQFKITFCSISLSPWLHSPSTLLLPSFLRSLPTSPFFMPCQTLQPTIYPFFSHHASYSLYMLSQCLLTPCQSFLTSCFTPSLSPHLVPHILPVPCHTSRRITPVSITTRILPAILTFLTIAYTWQSVSFPHLSLNTLVSHSLLQAD